MKNQPYYFEIKDLITQFIAAFDDVTINRYNRSRSVVDKIQVRYVYAPKQRVLNDLINKSQHLTLPVISITVGNIARDTDRVFNKITGFYDVQPHTASTEFLRAPVPINVDVGMSILTKYQTDMDQILSNFIPYSNPYIIISWKLPSKLTNQTVEIRSQVEWSGDVSLEYPSELTSDQPARVTADTSFTIKGWLFPYTSSLSADNIFYVKTHITPLTGFEYI